MCNCKKNVANNLSNRVIISEARDAFNMITNKGQDNLTESDWLYLYEVYSKAYPRSNGQPSRTELIQIIEKISQQKTAYR